MNYWRQEDHELFNVKGRVQRLEKQTQFYTLRQGAENEGSTPYFILPM